MSLPLTLSSRARTSARVEGSAVQLLAKASGDERPPPRSFCRIISLPSLPRQVLDSNRVTSIFFGCNGLLDSPAGEADLVGTPSPLYSYSLESLACADFGGKVLSCQHLSHSPDSQRLMAASRPVESVNWQLAAER